METHNRMVKNTFGGKGSKSMARKNESGFQSSFLRLSEDAELELYAIVTKSLGNCMFYVNTITGRQKLLLHLQGRFSGKNKRNNFVAIGAFVLVGLRSFEKPNYKTCDLLELYNSQDVKRLMKVPSITNADFFSQTVDSLNENGGNQIAGNDCLSNIFSNDAPIHDTTTYSSDEKVVEEEEIDIDDI